MAQEIKPGIVFGYEPGDLKQTGIPCADLSGPRTGYAIACDGNGWLWIAYGRVQSVFSVAKIYLKEYPHVFIRVVADGKSGARNPFFSPVLFGVRFIPNIKGGVDLGVSSNSQLILN